MKVRNRNRRFDTLDRIIEENLANGWAMVGEIRESGDGFELVELTAMMNGKPQWKRIAFNRIRERCVEAAKMRGLVLRGS